MPNDQLESFGKWLMQDVRERALTLVKEYAKGSTDSRIGRLVRDVMDRHSIPDSGAFAEIGALAVDLSLDSLLSAIQGSPQMKVLYSADGTTFADLNAASDGLAGELYTKDGWLRRFGISPSSIA